MPLLDIALVEECLFTAVDDWPKKMGALAQKQQEKQHQNQKSQTCREIFGANEPYQQGFKELQFFLPEQICHFRC